MKTTRHIKTKTCLALAVLTLAPFLFAGVKNADFLNWVSVNLGASSSTDDYVLTYDHATKTLALEAAAGGAPTGAAGGELSGTYPNPTIASGVIDADNLATDSVAADEIAASAVDTDELADNGVTLAKIATLTADRLVGSDGSGNPTEVTLGANLSLNTGNVDLSDNVSITTGLSADFVTADFVGKADQSTVFRGDISQCTGGSGSGDVVGPASSVDNEIPTFDGTGGKTIQSGSGITAASGSMAFTSNPGTKWYYFALDQRWDVNGTLEMRLAQNSFRLGSAFDFQVEQSGGVATVQADKYYDDANGIDTGLNVQTAGEANIVVDSTERGSFTSNGLGVTGNVSGTGYIAGGEKSADPDDPAEGEWVQWQSDGTGSGDDGDIMIKITAGSTTKTITLVDFSAF